MVYASLVVFGIRRPLKVACKGEKHHIGVILTERVVMRLKNSRDTSDSDAAEIDYASVTQIIDIWSYPTTIRAKAESTSAPGVIHTALVRS